MCHVSHQSNASNAFQALAWSHTVAPSTKAGRASCCNQFPASARMVGQPRARSPAQGVLHHTPAQLVINCGDLPQKNPSSDQPFNQSRTAPSIGDKMANDAPYMYSYSAVKDDDRFPTTTFDPKAVTRASWEKPKPKPKKKGPLVSVNRHPEYVSPRCIPYSRDTSHSTASLHPPCLLNQLD